MIYVLILSYDAIDVSRYIVRECINTLLYELYHVRRDESFCSPAVHTSKDPWKL